ncbi:hypothetical protein ABH310_03370 [Chromobacterium piscinae]
MSGIAPSSPRPTSNWVLCESATISSSAPSSTPLRPSFQLSITRVP